MAITCYKLTIETLELRRFGGFIVNFEHISHLCSSVSIVNFEQVNPGWIWYKQKKYIRKGYICKGCLKDVLLSAGDEMC